MGKQAARSAAQWVVVVRLGGQKGGGEGAVVFFLSADDGHVQNGILGESRGGG